MCEPLKKFQSAFICLFPSFFFFFLSQHPSQYSLIIHRRLVASISDFPWVSRSYIPRAQNRCSFKFLWLKTGYKLLVKNSSNRHLLTACCVPGTVLATCHITVPSYYNPIRLTLPHFVDGETVTQGGKLTIKLMKVFVKTH